MSFAVLNSTISCADDMPSDRFSVSGNPLIPHKLGTFSIEWEFWVNCTLLSFSVGSQPRAFLFRTGQGADAMKNPTRVRRQNRTSFRPSFALLETRLTPTK